MVARGARSSWLTMARNSARSRSSSWTSAISCMVTTIDSTAPSSERMGVALSSTVMLRPSGTTRTTSSARTFTAALISSAIGNSRSEISRPSPRAKGHHLQQVLRPTAPGSRRLSTILQGLPVQGDFGISRRSRRRPPRPPGRCRSKSPGRPWPAAPPGACGRWRSPAPPGRRTS